MKRSPRLDFSFSCVVLTIKCSKAIHYSKQWGPSVGCTTIWHHCLHSSRILPHEIPVIIEYWKNMALWKCFEHGSVITRQYSILTIETLFVSDTLAIYLCRLQEWNRFVQHIPGEDSGFDSHASLVTQQLLKNVFSTFQNGCISVEMLSFLKVFCWVF